MNTNENTVPTSDEKMMGAVAHAFGSLAAIIVWALQKDRSRFVKFQALQALIFQMVTSLFVMLFFFCIFSVFFIGIFATATANAPSSSDQVTPFLFLPMMFPLAIFGCMFPLSLLFLAARLVAAFSVLNGRNYHYPFIGGWLDNFLEE